jgi:hypothetical protein
MDIGECRAQDMVRIHVAHPSPGSGLETSTSVATMREPDKSHKTVHDCREKGCAAEQREGTGGGEGRVSEMRLLRGRVGSKHPRTAPSRRLLRGRIQRTRSHQGGHHRGRRILWQNFSYSGVEVRHSRLSGTRRIADVKLLLYPTARPT